MLSSGMLLSCWLIRLYVSYVLTGAVEECCSPASEEEGIISYSSYSSGQQQQEESRVSSQEVCNDHGLM